MPETMNIEALAELISKKIFDEFNWKLKKPININWNCEKPKQHGSEKSLKKTHPTDVVFYYNDPYSTKTVYVNCDLKSYAKDSITKSAIKIALKSLIKSVECANISKEWKNHYLVTKATPKVVGLLFVYNHDGTYDKTFNNELNLIDDLKIPKSVNISVFSPKLIIYLYSIAKDIKELRGDGKIAKKDECTFYYPDKQKSKLSNISGKNAATIETLLSPWIIYKSNSNNFIIYYLDSGETYQEFIYLIEYLFLYQLINIDYKLEIRALNANKIVSNNFDNAVRYYCENYQTDSKLENRLNQVKFSKVDLVSSAISDMDIGMGIRE